MKLTQDQISGIVRHALTAVGIFLVAKGGVTEANWEVISGSLLSLVSVVWSVRSKSTTA